MFNFNVVPLNIAELDRICEDMGQPAAGLSV